MFGKARKMSDRKKSRIYVVIGIISVLGLVACANEDRVLGDAAAGDSSMPNDSRVATDSAYDSVESTCLRAALRHEEECGARHGAATHRRICRAFDAHSSATGCGEQAIDFYECAGRFTAAQCEDDPVTRCGAEAAAWETCVDTSNADPCYETCRQAASSGCALTSTLCFAECYVARGVVADAECQGPFDGYHQCLAALPDICERDSCEDERALFMSCD